VDEQSGVPRSAGIPEGDEAFVSDAWMTELLAAKNRIESRGVEPVAQSDVASALAAKDRIEGTGVRPEPVEYLSQRQLEELASRPSARPDDVADRFAHSDVPAQPRLSAGDEWRFERTDALLIVIGGTVLALGLGLALGYITRPRIAGL
jgi:hypothetical protein